MVRAPVVIAAHGSWEVLPCARPQRRRARSPADLFSFKADFRASSLSEGLLPVLSFEGGYGGMVVGGAGTTTVACCISADRLEAVRRALPGASAGDAVEALLKRECAGVRSALKSATRDGTWIAAGPIDPGIRLRADDGPFRIGNAAGEAHPIIGEGISMALQSAWLLCGHLVDARTPEGIADPGWQREVARRYAAQWRRQFGPRLKLAAVFAHLAARPRSAWPLMAIAGAWPGLLTLGARWGGKTRCAIDPQWIAAVRRASPSSVPPATTAAEADFASSQFQELTQRT